MHKIILLVAIVFITLGTMQAADNFPEVHGWQIVSGPETYTSDDLWEIINGAADKYLQYGFRQLQYGVYQSAEGVEINVYIYQHADLKHAFGIYTQEKADDVTSIGLGAEGYIRGETVVFFKDCYYVKLYSNTQGVNNSIEKIASLIDKQMIVASAMPIALDMLPKLNIIENSETFIPNNLLGLSFLGNAYVADYEYNGSRYQVFAMMHSSSGNGHETINKYADFAGQKVDIKQNIFIEINDKYNGMVALVWKGNTVFGLVGYPPEPLYSQVVDVLLSTR